MNIFPNSCNICVKSYIYKKNLYISQMFYCIMFCQHGLITSSCTHYSGAIEPAPKIDGRHRAALTLQENATHRFNCQSDGWDPNAPPLLTWYLNGERQRETSPNRGRLVMTSQDDSKVMRPELNLNSTFSLRAKKWDRELVCVASNPRTGESYNATITLNVQCESV